MYEIGQDFDEDLLIDELLGYDEEDEYLLGQDPRAMARRFIAARKARARPRRARAPRGMARIPRMPMAAPRAVAAKQVAESMLVKERSPTKARELVLGFDSVANVAAAATANITSRPQVVFRPDRLVVAESIAASFLVNDLRVGKNSQLISGTAVPAEACSSRSVGVGLKCDTAQVSQDIVLNVTNVSLGALRFNAALIGPSLE